MFSFLSGFCLKYILVTGAKIQPGANIGRGLKVIKFYPEQSCWAADGEWFHADPGTWSFIHNVAHLIGARSVRNICLGLGAFTHKLMLKKEKTSMRGEKKDYSIILSYAWWDIYNAVTTISLLFHFYMKKIIIYLTKIHFLFHSNQSRCLIVTSLRTVKGHSMSRGLTLLILSNNTMLNYFVKNREREPIEMFFFPRRK